MIPGIFAAQAALSEAPAPSEDALIFPLTYDEMDADHAIALVREGGAGPHVTPAGFEGDGYEARYSTTAFPAWVNSGLLSLQASASIPNLPRRSPRDEIVSLCADDITAAARLGIAVREDERGALSGAIMLAAEAGGTQTLLLGRPGWKYELRVPFPTIGGYSAKPQAIHFVDSTTMIFSVHLDDTESVVYRVDLADNSITGQFTFGTSTYRHVATIAERPNGEIWMSDYETGMLLHVDLDASFSSGVAVILDTCEPAGITAAASIAFHEIGGVPYLLLQQYGTLDTDVYLGLYPESVLDSPSFTAADRFKQFRLGRRIQGITIRNGNLLVTRNNAWGALSPDGTIGLVQEFDIDGIAANLPDGAIVRSAVNSDYLLSEHVGPSSYVEDIAVHPVTNEVWIPTEGGYSVGDHPGFFGVWSGSLDESAKMNHYTVEYDGAGAVSVRVNNYLFATLGWTLDQAAGVLTIGGLPGRSPGFTAGYTFATIANVAIINGPIDSALYAAISSGSYEPSALTSYALTLVNPGAEAGDATGWTNETGGMAVRQENPPPFEGEYYFMAGPHVTTIARQRLDLLAQGVPEAAINSGKAWAKVRWKQSAYSDQDPGGMGLRTLTPADSTIATQYSGLAWTPFGGGAGGPWYWYPRAYPVALDPATRKLDALFNAGPRTSGTNNDHYVDAVSVTIYVP